MILRTVVKDCNPSPSSLEHHNGIAIQTNGHICAGNYRAARKNPTERGLAAGIWRQCGCPDAAPEQMASDQTLGALPQEASDSQKAGT